MRSRFANLLLTCALAVPGFTPETEVDPEYGPDEAFNKLLKDEQHAANLESLNKGSKTVPLHRLDPHYVKYEPKNVADEEMVTFSKLQVVPRRSTVSVLTLESDATRMCENLHQQLKTELQDAQYLNTINTISKEQQSIAYGLEKRDLQQIQRDFGQDETQMRKIIKLLIDARQGKAPRDTMFDFEA